MGHTRSLLLLGAVLVCTGHAVRGGKGGKGAPAPGGNGNSNGNTNAQNALAGNPHALNATSVCDQCFSRAAESWQSICTNTTLNCSGCPGVAQACSYCHNNNNKTGCFDCNVHSNMKIEGWSQTMHSCLKYTSKAQAKRDVNASAPDMWGQCTACHNQCGDRFVLVKSSTSDGKPRGHCMNFCAGRYKDGICKNQKALSCSAVCNNPDSGKAPILSATSSLAHGSGNLACTKVCTESTKVKVNDDPATRAALGKTADFPWGNGKIYARCNLYKVTQCKAQNTTVSEKLGEFDELGDASGRPQRHSPVSQPQVPISTCDVRKEVQCAYWKFEHENDGFRSDYCPTFLCEQVAVVA